MADKKKGKHTEAYIVIIAVLLVLIYLWWKLRTPSSSTTGATIPAAATPPQNGVVNVTYQNQPSTSGINTYIPLFGFLRFGSFFG
jgi:hypothetical protein